MSARWRSPVAWLGVASAALVVLFVVWDAKRVSPGPISAVHAQSGVAADSDCAACHGGVASSMRAACASCHAAVEAQIERSTGFHGTLADASRCGRCHVEHHGRDAELAGPVAFALAGVPDRDAYRHEGLGFSLAGAHTTLSCAECHPRAGTKLLARGETRFAGLDQRCTSCHEDPHEGRLEDCASCHGQSEPFASAAEFEHTAEFPLEGSHAGLACATCHEKGGEHSIEALGARRGGTRSVRDCAACHPSPHAPLFLAAVASERGLAPDAACVECHPTSDATFARPEAEMRKDLHALSGFALDPPHERASCEACHSPTALKLASAPISSFATLHPGRASNDCAACHADPHEGQFAGAACLACHSNLAFEPHRFDVARHASTSFALDGAHAAVSCERCHARRSPGGARAFHGTAHACSACHADAHRGFFATHAKPDLVARANECSACHSTTAFDDERARGFDHAAWTGFALDGEHATAACEACHRAFAKPDQHGRTFGTIAGQVQGRPQECATCHFDVHGAFFDAFFGAKDAGKANCAECHDPRGFELAAAEFDHAARARFALTGAHARAACASCHPDPTEPDELGRRVRATVGRGRGSFDDCRTCHSDPHGGAFDRGSTATACTECHVTESFEAARASFDHARHTGFALEGAHSAVACQGCHAPLATPEPSGRAFARAAGERCSDCHDDPHAGQFARDGQLARDRATSCDRCHTTASTFESLVFDHRRHSRFALDATHARLDCAACHRPAALPGGTSTVRYKPLGTTCGDCHDPRGGRRDGEPR